MREQVDYAKMIDTRYGETLSPSLWNAVAVAILRVRALYRKYFRAVLVGCLVHTFGAAVDYSPAAAALSCNFYDRAEKDCGCNRTDRYLITYGKRYCERFLNATGWTPAGAKWRDETLVCLQKSLSSALHRGQSGICDCKNIRDIAWRTHVRCYTEPSASVCRLPLSDVLKIYSIVDTVDLLSPYGLSQTAAIANACWQQR